MVRINGAALNDSVYYYYDTERLQTAVDKFVQLEEVQGNVVNMGRFDKGKLTAKAANLTDISWAHAVNSQQLLSDALSGKYAPASSSSPSLNLLFL